MMLAYSKASSGWPTLLIETITLSQYNSLRFKFCCNNDQSHFSQNIIVQLVCWTLILLLQIFLNIFQNCSKRQISKLWVSLLVNTSKLQMHIEIKWKLSSFIIEEKLEIVSPLLHYNLECSLLEIAQIRTDYHYVSYLFFVYIFC